MLDAKEILIKLIPFESTTPDQTKLQDYLETLVKPFGFKSTKIHSENVPNLYCEFDTKKPGPHLAFCGHTDVVPPGDLANWQSNPFKPTIKGNTLYGRGAVDMKAGLAASIAAGCNLAKKIPCGKISFLITGDEEGEAIHGTQKILEYLRKKSIQINDCIIAEPTSEQAFGDTIKPGRRGSLHGKLTVFGKQGHTAYPDSAENPHIALVKILDELQNLKFDDGYGIFPPSNLEVVSIDTKNNISNIIPAETTTHFNIRFNPHHTAESLEKKLHEHIAAITTNYTLKTTSNAPAFLSPDTKLKLILKEQIKAVTNIDASFRASGGSSDARFIQTYCPVVEFGPLNHSMHKIDEHIPLEHLEKLQKIFEGTINTYFS